MFIDLACHGVLMFYYYYIITINFYYVFVTVD